MASNRSLLATTAIAPALWGTTYLVTTEFLPPDRPFLAGTLRALPAGLILLAFTRTLPRNDWWWKALVLGTLNIGAFFAFLFISAYRLPGGVSATLGAVNPIIATLLAMVILHEAVRRNAIIAALLGIAGVGMLVLSPAAQLDTIGVIAGLLGGTSTALGVVLTKRWGRPVPLLTFTAWQLVAGGLVLLIPTLAFEGLPDALSVGNLAGYVWLAIAGAVVSYLLWFRGILALPASKVVILTFFAPLVATMLGVVVLHESLSPVQWAGAGVILFSVWLGSRKGNVTTSDDYPQEPPVAGASPDRPSATPVAKPTPTEARVGSATG
ncbi:EamA family transporter [Demequina aurantiaca]|uniref:EamA family transporter n=1 Tax=Demequina aurantiaca TaxID=676200 RepID=UPI000784B63D|nr:EamA family transporter [Demequina aurantiaca]